jgi:hypothetical protein
MAIPRHYRIANICFLATTAVTGQVHDPLANICLKATPIADDQHLLSDNTDSIANSPTFAF